MYSQVEASTVTAGQLFAANRFLVPDFQREYSWEVKEQITDFWRDLSYDIDEGDYFLGLVILTDGRNHKEIVDGQQRLITLAILANAIRLAATEEGRKLVADSIRSSFLFWVDYRTEEQEPRLRLTEGRDADDLGSLLRSSSSGSIVPREGSRIFAAHRYLTQSLDEDLERSENPALRLGQWAEFISTRLNFTVFTHPDRNAAFRVYEVVNRRGKDLTPAELIKSYLIGSSSPENRENAFERWKSIEGQFDELSALNQVTSFVRHTVTLERGYVIPRNLYQVVTERYRDDAGVQDFLTTLELHQPAYLQMIDPSLDVDASEVTTRTFSVLHALSAGRFRPIFMEAVRSPRSDELMRRLLDIVAPGVIAAGFGTGSIEAQFARAARRIHMNDTWDTELIRLSDLRPPREEFSLKVSQSLNKSYAHVVRSAVIQHTTLPSLDGYIHQVRPRGARDWPRFSEDLYRDLGGTIGNTILIDQERRPQGAKTPEAVRDRMVPLKVQNEPLEPEDLAEWGTDHVREITDDFARHATELWYGSA